MVRRAFPEVGLYASEQNLGYTGGNNLGMAASRGRYVLILNPDTEVVGAALPAMVAYMDAHPAVGVLGPQLLWPDGTVQRLEDPSFNQRITVKYGERFRRPVEPATALDYVVWIAAVILALAWGIIWANAKLVQNLFLTGQAE